jgi:hypothetical protein
MQLVFMSGRVSVKEFRPAMRREVYPVAHYWQGAIPVFGAPAIHGSSAPTFH